MAAAYVKLIIGFMRDRQLQTDIPADSTLYIMELGAGSGRFSFHMMQRLCKILQKSPLRSVRFKYIMSDFSSNALEFWKNHPSIERLLRLSSGRFLLLAADKGEVHANSLNNRLPELLVMAAYR